MEGTDLTSIYTTIGGVHHSKEEKMSEIVTAIVSAIPSSALPLLVCILGCCFIYFKINSQRKVSKEERDNINEAFDLRLTLCEHDIAFMKQEHSLFAGKLDKILTELTEIKVALAKKADIKQAHDD